MTKTKLIEKIFDFPIGKMSLRSLIKSKSDEELQSLLKSLDGRSISDMFLSSLSEDGLKKVIDSVKREIKYRHPDDKRLYGRLASRRHYERHREEIKKRNLEYYHQKKSAGVEVKN